MSLATKYRPTKFEDVVGQEKVTTILTKEIQTNTTKQAYLFVGKTGSGKAQPLYSKLLTPNGYITMGDIKIGDEVFGEDGNPHRILGIFPQGKKKVYRVTFSDGTTCDCTDEHLWKVSYNNRKNWVYMELKDIRNDKLKREGSSWKYCIPITNPINYPKRKLPIDPWLFGIMLGDGGFTNDSIAISLYEQDIEDRVRDILSKDGFELNYFTKNHIEVKDFRIKDARFDRNTTKLSKESGIFGNRMKQYIYDLGLLNHKSEQKFIPKTYMTSCYADRLALLQGIFDSDGTLNESVGKYDCKSSLPSISTSSKQLALNIIELIQSLGGTATCGEKPTFYTHKGQRKQGLTSYRIYFKLPKGVCYCTSKKHLMRYRIPMYEPYRTIRNIEYIGEEECQCIYIDSPSHLYLTDNMIVTHNTTISKILANALDSEILEIDAASNNSAEAMRTLLESVKTRPLTHKYTVVILDECHVLGQIAVQTLLKTIEETPKHLIFILCTTEGDKIPQTIYNRCEVFEFISISVEQIIQRLEYICKQEQFKYEKEALSIIANMADGSMRQAISYLEQCSTLPITVETVKKILCANTYDNYLNLIYAVLDDNYEAVVKLIKNVYDIDKYVAGLFSFLLDVNIYNKTRNIKLLSIPSIYAEDFNKLTTKDQKDIEKLCNMLLDLQFEGRDNPLLKQLLIASLYREMGV